MMTNNGGHLLWGSLLSENPEASLRTLKRPTLVNRLDDVSGVFSLTLENANAAT